MPRFLPRPRQKTGSMASGITEAKRCTFWPRPNMPRFQTRGKMWKITGTESPFCTGADGWGTCGLVIIESLLWGLNHTCMVQKPLFHTLFIKAILFLDTYLFSIILLSFRYIEELDPKKKNLNILCNTMVLVFDIVIEGIFFQALKNSTFS